MKVLGPTAVSPQYVIMMVRCRCTLAMQFLLARQITMSARSKNPPLGPGRPAD